MFEFEELENGKLEVKVSRKLKVGQILKINPSESYLGIMSGNIRILAFVPAKPDNEEVYTSLADTEEIISDIEEFKEVELDFYELESEEYKVALNAFDSQPWVVYKYTKFNETSADEWNVLPLDMFVEHSMGY